MIIPYDEADTFGPGDVLYRYVDTLIFHAFEDDPDVDLGPDLTAQILDGETLHATLIARLWEVNDKRIFFVEWLPKAVTPEEVMIHGYILQSETVARRLFEMLSNWKFTSANVS